MEKTFTEQDLINGVQTMFNAFLEDKERFGIEYAESKLDWAIGCKEMVEMMIQKPVNLKMDGRVTVGF